MALFNKKENKKESKVETKSVIASASVPREVRVSSASVKHAGAILLSPRITEKGAYVAEGGIYVFNVAKDANKREISLAVQELFKVTPRQIRVVHVPSKKAKSRSFNRMFKTASGKKAYVFLKKGETIEVV